jgi:hypothetical protein
LGIDVTTTNGKEIKYNDWEKVSTTTDGKGWVENINKLF